MNLHQDGLILIWGYKNLILENRDKIAIICGSDHLALPTIFELNQEKFLGGVILLKKYSHLLAPQLISLGVAKDKILLLEKNLWARSLTEWLTQNKIEVVFVFGFPWKVEESIRLIPKFGFLNFHFGALPKYAGADPIFWQLKNGEGQIELIVHQMTDQIDQGPVVFSRPFDIIPGENYAMLCSRLGIQTAMEIRKINHLFRDNSSFYTQQRTAIPQYESRPSISDLTIKWSSQCSEEIERLVNASNPKYGGAITFLGDKELRILEVSPVDMKDQPNTLPGVVVYADQIYGLIVSCKDNQYLRIGIAHLSEGYFSGTKLFNIGIKAGAKFN